MVGEPKKTGMFFGWRTVLVTGVVTGLGIGFYTYGISALFKPIAADLDLSRALTSGGSAIGLMVGSLLVPLAGWAADRFGPRSAIAAGLFTVIAGLVMMNFVDSIQGFYLVWGMVIGVGINLGLTVSIDKALSNWFVRKIGLAMGIKFALISLVCALSMPLVSWLVARVGWRTTCLVWAVLLLIGVPFVFFSVKNERPEFFGLLPDDDPKDPDRESGPQALPQEAADDDAGRPALDFSLRQASRTGAYWIFALCLVVQFFITSGFTTHLIPFLTEMNIDPVVAGSMMGIMLIFTIPSRFFGGLIADRISRDHLKILLAVPFILLILGMAGFLLYPSIGTIYVLLVCYGLAHGLPTPLIIICISRYFGRRAFGAISGTAVMFRAPAAFIAPILTGWIFDTTGNYAAALMIFSSASLAVVIVLSFLKTPVKNTHS